MCLPQSFLERSISYLRANDMEDHIVGSLNLEGLGEDAIGPLCEEVENGVNGSRARAAEVLARIGDARAVPALLRVLGEDEIQSDAAYAVGRIIRGCPEEELAGIGTMLSERKGKAGNMPNGVAKDIAFLLLDRLRLMVKERECGAGRPGGRLSERAAAPCRDAVRRAPRRRILR